MPIELTPLGLFEGEIFSNVNFFLLFMVFLGGFIGILSRSLALGAYGAFMFFVHIAVKTEIDLFVNALYVVMGLVLVAMAFRIWGFLAEGGSTASPSGEGEI